MHSGSAVAVQSEGGGCGQAFSSFRAVGKPQAPEEERSLRIFTHPLVGFRGETPSTFWMAFGKTCMRFRDWFLRASCSASETDLWALNR